MNVFKGLMRPCPYDTNGDGDCGRGELCPWCGAPEYRQYAAVGQIWQLPTGVTVVLTADRGGRSWNGMVVASSHPSYPVGGYDIVVPETEMFERGIPILLEPPGQRRVVVERHHDPRPKVNPTPVDMTLLLHLAALSCGAVLSVEGLDQCTWSNIPASTWWPRYRPVDGREAEA